MSADLRQEMDKLRRTSFGPRYEKILNALDGSTHRKEEFRELEDFFFYLVTYIIGSQSPEGWWNVDQMYQKVITAHAVRHLHRIGISLRARWNLEGSPPETGNLFRAVERLIDSFHEPRPDKYARWGDDIWDDCYILLALLEVDPDFEDVEVQKWNVRLKNKWERRYSLSLKWLHEQFDHKGFNESVAKAGWYGPGFYAAAIELFDHPRVKKDFGTEGLIESLVTGMKSLLKQRATGTTQWEGRFAWHAGQVLVTWNEKRAVYPSLKKLNPMMEQLFDELKKRQNKKSKPGIWDERGRILNEEDQVYYTVRALAACYVNTAEEKFSGSDVIKRTHAFLLDLFRKHPDGLLLNLKASINALEAFQKLFDFGIRNSFPNLLLSLTTRLNRLGLLDNVLKPLESDADTLKEIQASARKRREDRGDTGLELVGVNDRLYQDLEGRDEFLNEFTGDRNQSLSENERDEIRSELRRFLSATITETRSRSSRRLIKALWQTSGFLNFLPLIKHLSDLEQDRAFYEYYRDHVNHEVLLFLLGAYIYYNCGTFRKPINDEILRIYDAKKIPFDEADLEAEFLFRWKLISTFHDIGYLFEVEPLQRKSERRPGSKERMLKKSFGVVDDFRENFLFDYFMQYVETPRKVGHSEKENETAREKEVRRLAASVKSALKIKPYPGKITRDKDLFKLVTVNDGAFKFISQHVRPKYIAPGLIEDYFKLCKSTAPEEIKDGRILRKRPKFFDHGIMSALVFLKATDTQRHYLNELVSKDFSGELLNDYPQLRNMLSRTKIRDQLDVKEFFVRFSHVAGAMALHNINPGLYMEQQCETFDKNNGKAGKGLARAFDPRRIGKLRRYAITLEENPLSYLTALADTLQDWDRHSFRSVSFDEEPGDPLSSSEVIIGINNDKVNVRPLTGEAKERYASLTKPNAMDQYLLDWRKYVEIPD